MKYIINGMTTYNSADGTLFNTDNSVDMTALGRVPNELLLLLVKNNGVSLRREDILTELWEKKGLSASSNNLNNHVSMLRKALIQCGLPDLITTIPKYGFIFEAEITPVFVGTAKKKDAPPAINTPQIQSRPSVTLSMLMRKFMVIPCLILVLVGAVLLLTYVYDELKVQSLRTKIMSDGQCQFYLMGEKAKGMDRERAAKVIKIISSSKRLDCKKKNTVYFFAENRMDAIGTHFVGYLLAACQRDGKTACDNYYYSQNEGHDEN